MRSGLHRTGTVISSSLQQYDLIKRMAGLVGDAGCKQHLSQFDS
jgi:hypothetical protein